MPKGGARNRSGPPSDPHSIRSAKRGLSTTALPAAGHKGKAPAWPLPDPSKRELARWTQVWKTPQAEAWKRETWRWPTIAMYVRWSVRMEDPDASASLGSVVIRLQDQIGLSPAGLSENGWSIAADEVEKKRVQRTTRAAAPRTARSRFKVVTDAAGG